MEDMEELLGLGVGGASDEERNRPEAERAERGGCSSDSDCDEQKQQGTKKE